jgi:hypothetical protein
MVARMDRRSDGWMKGDGNTIQQNKSHEKPDKRTQCDAKGREGAKNDDSIHVLIHSIDEKLPSIHIDGCADKKVRDRVVISRVWVGFGADISNAFEPGGSLKTFKA